MAEVSISDMLKELYSYRQGPYLDEGAIRTFQELSSFGNLGERASAVFEDVSRLITLYGDDSLWQLYHAPGDEEVITEFEAFDFVTISQLRLAFESHSKGPLAVIESLVAARVGLVLAEFDQRVAQSSISRPANLVDEPPIHPSLVESDSERHSSNGEKMDYGELESIWQKVVSIYAKDEVIWDESLLEDIRSLLENDQWHEFVAVVVARLQDYMQDQLRRYLTGSVDLEQLHDYLQEEGKLLVKHWPKPKE